MTIRIFVLLQLLCILCMISEGKSPPNIIFILADDLGWDDVSFHGSEIQTPNIDKLAQEGVILNNYYVQPICTPTRGALLSGRYPIHTGLQHYVIAGSQPYGLPLTEVTIAQHLKTLGYSTHAVGKWHLGFCTPAYLPENRGFDSHLGYYLGLGDYFDHHGHDGGYMGYDFHYNGEALWNQSEIYATEIYTAQAESIISSHDKSKPLFLYLAHQAVHAGNADDKIQAPQKYIDRFPNIQDIDRRMFAGVVSALDDSVGAVYKALSDAGMLDNTVIMFSTDNGGPANGYDGNAACNWPLRGTKNTLWQGGTRGVGFVHSPLLQKQGYINENLMHVTDWLPTIFDIAGGNTSSLGNVDGVDQWKVISENISTTRKEVLLNIDPIMKHEALIVGDFKLIYGDISDGRDDGWYPPPHVAQQKSEAFYFHDKYLDEYLSKMQGQEPPSPTSVPNIMQSDVIDLIDFMNSQYEKLKREKSKEKTRSPVLMFLSEAVSKSDSLTEGIPFKDLQSNGMSQLWNLLVHKDHSGISKEVRHKHNPNNAGMDISLPVIVDCGQKPKNASENCKPEKAPCLFHIKDDPCEYNNLADAMPTVVKQLQARMDVYRSTMIPPGNKPEDPKGNPQLHGGVWVPWL